MVPEIKKYPLDLTAEAISNRIDKEVHVVEDLTASIIVLNAGVFYKRGLIIRHVEQNNILTLKKDFILNYLHTEVTRRSGFGAYSLLVMKDENFKGTLEITYQAVGGQYSRIDDAIAEAIDDVFTSPTVVYWHDIRNKPLVFPPEPHEHDAGDITGMDDVVESLDSIASAIKGEHPEEIERLEELIATKVTNLNYMKINQVNINWALTPDAPLRISATPFPSVIIMAMDVWQAGQGHSALEVSGELTADGDWLHRKYTVVSGLVPSLEMQLFTIDGTSAEVLIKTDSEKTITIVPTFVRYLKHRPEVTSLSCLDLDTITVPIPDEYEPPVPSWI